MRPHVVERDISFGIDQIGGISEATVKLVRGTLQIIDEHCQGNAFLLLVTLSILPFLLKTLIGRHFGAWMRLPDEDIHEVYFYPPTRMEPFQRLVVPRPGFLEGVRAITARHGVPLVFDEIVTGFRFAYGGAQEYYGVVPDVVALGKVVGGGFPLSAVAGQRDIMRHLAPDLDGTPEFVAQAGTLNGNPIAAAAGLAPLAELRKPGAYARLFATGTRLKDGLAAAARSAGLAAQVAGEPPVFEIFFTDRPITDYRSSLTADRDLHAAFTRAMLERGVVKAAGKFYVSLAHGADDVDRTIEIFAAALKAAAEATP